MMDRRSAKKWVLAPFVLGLLLVASIPSITGQYLTPQGTMWTGILSRNTGDFNGYLSIVEEIRSNGLIGHNLMTTEPHPAFQIRPFHALLGLIGRVFRNLSPVALLEIGRLIASSIFLILVIYLVTRLYDSNRDRIFSFLLITMGSGLGWLHLIHDPPDLRYVELSTFLALVSPPLYQVSLSCILGIILLITAAYQSSSAKRRVLYSFFGAGLAVLLGFERPFPLITLGFTLLGFFLIEVRRDKSEGIKFLLIILPINFAAGLILFYQFQLMQSIPVYAEWNRQHIVMSPSLTAILQSLGLMILLAIFGFNELRNKNQHLALLFCLYIASSLICSKMPVQTQERFLESLPLSTAVIASAGLVRLMRFSRRPLFQNVIALLVLTLLVPSSWIGLRSDLKAITKKSPPQYMPLSFIQAIEVLEEKSRPDEAILSLEIAGNFIAAYASRPAVLAHRVATSRHTEKRRLVAHLLEVPSQHPMAKQFILETKAQWLFWGPEERDYSRGRFNPDQAPYLIRSFTNDIVTIYRIEF